MISVVILTSNDEATLVETLTALVPAAADGIVQEVALVDAGSTDATHDIADAAGCKWVRADGPVDERRAAGVACATRGSWLLFLEPGMVLEADWHVKLGRFLERAERSGQSDRMAARFRLVLDDFGWRARLAERLHGLRGLLPGAGRSARALLISRRLYEAGRRGSRNVDAPALPAGRVLTLDIRALQIAAPAG